MTQAFRTNVVSLTNTSFPSKLERRQKWLVNFYSSRCLYCRTALSQFREASVRAEYPAGWARSSVDPSNKINYGSIDCSKYRQLCNELKVSLFPHIAYYDRLYDKSVAL